MKSIKTYKIDYILSCSDKGLKQKKKNKKNL